MKYCACFFLLSGMLLANPSDLSIVHGDAQLREAEGLMQIYLSDKAILDWGSFSIGQGETTQFFQPSADSAVLNRVIGGNMSEIYGNLQANGKVYLFNPNGIIVGSEGVINTAAFIATTLQVTDKEFLSQQEMTFLGESCAAVQNFGTIQTPCGPTVLLAHQVKNEGTITAAVASLGSGHEFYLQKEGIAELLIRPDILVEGIENQGVIEGMIIQLQADGATSFAIQQGGILQAKCVDCKGGKIFLKTSGNILIEKEALLCAPHGEVNVEGGHLCLAGEIAAGSIDIEMERGFVATLSSRLKGQQILVNAARLFTSGAVDASGYLGGSISLFGEEIALCGAHLMADGEISAGKIFVGGKFGGAAHEFPNAQNVFVNEATKISAGNKEQTGEVILWAEEQMECRGTIEAAFVEVSGKELIQTGAVKAKHLLLDPENVIISSSYGSPYFAFIEPLTSTSGFGDSVVALASGNVAIASPNANGGQGAVYLYAISTGALINYVTGSAISDNVGSGGLFAVYSNNNYVISSPNWNNNSGAATWVNGSSGLMGVVSISNSLYGYTTTGHVSNGGITALADGSYAVSSYLWGSSSSVTGMGAATWGSGNAGVTGLVSSSNSLVGANAGASTGDRVSSGGIIALSEDVEGNYAYVVASPYWSPSGQSTYVGAVTWSNTSSPVTGAVTSSNSLYGNSSDDYISSGGITALPTGFFTIASPLWSNVSPVVSQVGSVIFIAPGGNAPTGPLAYTGDFVKGVTANDRVGYGGVVYLPSSTAFVVSSPYWSIPSGNSSVGAVTYVDYVSLGLMTVTSSNSMIGSLAGDNVGGTTVNSTLKGSIYPLGNGNYVIGSGNWSSNLGAATYINTTGATSGMVSSSNSIVGVTTGDHISSGGVIALNGSNDGNFVVASPSFSSDRGAATWSNGSVVGMITPSNSFVGVTTSDAVGHTVIALADGNYVVGSPGLTQSAHASAGAATWFNGSNGESYDNNINPTVSAANSLYGGAANVQVGYYLTACSGSAYIVGSYGTGYATYLPSKTSYLGAVAADLSVFPASYSTNAMSAPIDNEAGDIFVLPYPGSGTNVVLAGIKNYTDLATASKFSSATVYMSPAYIESIVNAGTSLTIAALNNITVESGIVFTEVSAGSFTLSAGGGLTIDISPTPGSIISNATSLDFSAVGSFTIDSNQTISTNTGSISLTGGSVSIASASVIFSTSSTISIIANSSTLSNAGSVTTSSASGGNITLHNTATGGAASLSNSGMITANAGHISVATSGGGLSDSGGSYTTSTGTISIISASTLNFNGSTFSADGTNGTITVNATNDFSLQNTITISSGSTSSFTSSTGNIYAESGATIDITSPSCAFIATEGMLSDEAEFHFSDGNLSFTSAGDMILTNAGYIYNSGSGNFSAEVTGSSSSLQNAAQYIELSGGNITLKADNASTLSNNGTSLTTDSSGTISLITSTGALTDVGGSYSTNSGEISFSSGSTIAFSGTNISSTAGEISLVASGAITTDSSSLIKTTTTGSSGNISVTSTGSSINNSAPFSTASASGGNITLTSETDLTNTGTITTKAGNVTLSAGATLTMEGSATGSVTTDSSAGAGTGNISLTSVGAMLLTGSASFAAEGDGNITMHVTGTSLGDTFSNDNTEISTNSGNIDIQTAGDRISAGPGPYTSDSGTITFSSATDLTFDNDTTITATASSITVTAEDNLIIEDNIAITAGTTATFTATTGNINLSANSNGMSISATSTTFTATAGELNDDSFIGFSGDLSFTSASTMTLSNIGYIYNYGAGNFTALVTGASSSLNNSASSIILSGGNISLTAENATTLSNASTLSTNSTGTISLITSTGALTDDGGSYATDSGQISVTSGSTIGFTGTTISSTSGEIMIEAGSSITIDSTSKLKTTTTGTSGNISLQSTGSSITNSAPFSTASGLDGNISITADTTLLNNSTGTITTNAGNITLTTETGNLTNDAELSSSSGTITINSAAGLSNSAAIATLSTGTISIMSAAALADNGGSYTTSSGEISFNASSTLGFTGTTVSSTTGAIMIEAGSTITINNTSSVHTTTTGTSGNISLQSTGSSITNSAPFSTASAVAGNISITADTTLLNNSTGTITTNVGNITLTTDTGSLTNDAALSSDSGRITLNAAAGLSNSGVLSTLSTGTISLLSVGALADNGGSYTTASGQISIDSGSTLSFTATNVISTSGTILIEAVSTLTTNSTSLIKTSTAGSSGNISLTSTASSITNAAAISSESSSGGDISLTVGTNLTNSGAISTEAGSVTLTATDAGDLVQSANIHTGSSNITLQASDNITLLDAPALSSVTGNIYIIAGNDLLSSTGAPSITTSSNGSVFLVAADDATSPTVGAGLITLDPTTTVSTNGGAGGGGSIVQLYTSTPTGNLFPTHINGAATPGLYQYYFVYYPDGSGGDPFAIFYQATSRPIPPTPTPSNPSYSMLEMNAALNEEFIELCVYDLLSDIPPDATVLFYCGSGGCPTSCTMSCADAKSNFAIEQIAQDYLFKDAERNRKLAENRIKREREPFQYFYNTADQMKFSERLDYNRINKDKDLLRDYYEIVVERPKIDLSTKAKESFGSMILEVQSCYFQLPEKQSQINRALEYSKSLQIFYRDVGIGPQMPIDVMETKKIPNSSLEKRMGKDYFEEGRAKE